MKVELPTTLDIPTNSWFSTSLPLCALLTNSEIKEWYYENYINIYSAVYDNFYFVGFPGDMLSGYIDVLNYHMFIGEEYTEASIVETIKKEISKNKRYAYIYLDEYYLPCMSSYNSKHHRHQSLIYGYNEETETFLAIAFDKSGHLSYLEYPYLSVEHGYLSALKDISLSAGELFGVIFFEYKIKFNYKLSVTNIIRTLQEYVNETQPQNIRVAVPAVLRRHENKATSFGLSLVKKMIKILDEIDFSNYSFEYFRKVHFLQEHAKMLLERLKFYGEFFNIKEAEYYEFVLEYEDLVKYYERARMLFLKMEYYLKKVDVKTTSRHLKIIDGIKDIYRSIYVNEKRILSDIICFLKQNVSETKNIDTFVTNASKKFYKKTFIVDGGIMVTYSSKTYLPINTLSFFPIDDVFIYLDDQLYTLFYIAGLPKIEDIQLTINQWVKEISFYFPNLSKVDCEELKFNAFVGNLFHQAKATSSSFLRLGDDKSSVTTYCAENALVGNSGVYWRAAIQTKHYDGKDWLEISMRQPSKLNCICISELTYSQRLSKYTIMYTDVENNEHKLLSYVTDNSCNYINYFSNIIAKSVRVVFDECHCDENGYAEPIISRIEGYQLQSNVKLT